MKLHNFKIIYFLELFSLISSKLDIHCSIAVYPKLQKMTQSLPLACKAKKLRSKFGQIFSNNLYYNYSCADFHELNMSCV